MRHLELFFFKAVEGVAGTYQESHLGEMIIYIHTETFTNQASPEKRTNKIYSDMYKDYHRKWLILSCRLRSPLVCKLENQENR